MLIAHSGSTLVEREALADAPCPQRTATHVPVPHAAFVDTLHAWLAYEGIQPAAEEYALTKDGLRMFGVIALHSEHPDWQVTIGLRNAHDKSFSAGLAAGSRVIVCDNLSFSAEVVSTRKHTGRILDELPVLVRQMLQRTLQYQRGEAGRIDRMREIPVDDVTAHDTVCRAVRSRILPASRVPDVLRNWHEPPHEEFQPRTAWSLYNGFTETAKLFSTDLRFPRLLQLSDLFRSRFELPSLN